MRLSTFFLLTLVCNSCILFSDFKKTQFSFVHDDMNKSVNAVVPKRYSKLENKVDSTGNQVQYYFYKDGAVLYFALMKDTSAQLQLINYDLNIPKELYHTVYFKGLDSSDHYWRETRFRNYRAGYKNVDKGEDGKFDSSINYFSLHMKD